MEGLAPANGVVGDSPNGRLGVLTNMFGRLKENAAQSLSEVGGSSGV